MNLLISRLLLSLPRLLRYGFLALIIAIICIVTSPVIAKNNPESVVNSQENQAQILYDQGRFAESLTLLKQSLQNYQSNGKQLEKVVILMNMSLNYQQTGEISAANKAIEEAINILQKIPDHSQNSAIWAQAWDVKGSLQLAQGKPEDALLSWQQAEAIYQKLGDSNKAILMGLNQGQALQNLGLYKRASSVLQALSTTLENQPDSLTKAISFRNLGTALRLVGDLENAESNLKESLKIAEKLQSPANISAAYLALGNIILAEANIQSAQGKMEAAKVTKIAAINFYEKAEVDQTSIQIQIRAKINRLRLLIAIEKLPEAELLYPQIQSLIPKLFLGRSGIYSQVNFAQSLMKLNEKIPVNLQTIAQILAVARQQAEQIQDVRSQSFVLGNLGHIYELTKQWNIAQDLTQKALNLSQSIQAEDITYRWQWQIGRILCQGETQCYQRGDIQGAIPTERLAIATYTDAFNTLQSLRGDLVASSADVQYSFKQSVEPVYRQLVNLLLQSPEPSQDNLKQARQVLETLQIAKLQNFLQQACQDSKLQLDQVIDTKDQTAAVIYSIILNDRLEVILREPNNPELSHYYTSKLSTQEIENTLDHFYTSLQDPGAYEEVQNDGQQVYNWLIKPIAKRLEEDKIKTLIFVLDGSLRKIPMAALYDGEKYLMEKYAISLALGLQIRDPLPLQRQEMKILAASLKNPPASLPNFSVLPGVEKEVQEIQKMGLAVTRIAEAEFTTENFNKKLNRDKFNIVHLATHGYFGADRENTFVVTANGKLNISEFDQLFRTQRKSNTQGIELLILSACQTATGNDQEIMGIAGTTVQAGASSAIASLWDLDDQSSVPFIKEFYQHLGKPNISRAEALRLAQQSLLKNENYDHPRYWSPYVLVGNWL
ncbi:CHAT domain-containing protein [Dolichospermum sp. UHCC 0259]|uniref:CHAT domain-containing protein n=1 Tax=Dolichospermum sp. UHCC 0259 TaxID=2590010 RepID=UPI0014489E74|nr:CHAT domain-containing protein [Dolichospermum sp. UHCC 0259]MTJ50050.1 CHAT domain-containing protein [Dolichospermum sp. UHCC 0259]